MKHPRAVFAAAAVVLGLTVVLTLHGPRECCMSAHAQTQTQTAPPEPATESTTAPAGWDHNGSVMVLVENGASREFHYQTPRPGMVEAGARSGSLLFRGRVDNGQYSGTAYIFNPRCGPIPFEVTGAALDNDERIVLTGQAPQVGRNCRPYGFFTSTLEFKRLNPTAPAPSQQPLIEATPAPSVEQSGPQTPSGMEAETSPRRRAEPKASPDIATAQLPATHAATNATPSAAKSLDNLVKIALILAVILVVGAAAMLAAA